MTWCSSLVNERNDYCLTWIFLPAMQHKQLAFFRTLTYGKLGKMILLFQWYAFALFHQQIVYLSSLFLSVHIIVFLCCLQVDFEIRDGRFQPLVHNSLDDWNSNLRTILSWSPFPAEDDLFYQVFVWKSSFFYSLKDIHCDVCVLKFSHLFIGFPVWEYWSSWDKSYYIQPVAEWWWAVGVGFWLWWWGINMASINDDKRYWCIMNMFLFVWLFSVMTIV